MENETQTTPAVEKKPKQAGVYIAVVKDGATNFKVGEFESKKELHKALAGIPHDDIVKLYKGAKPVEFQTKTSVVF